MDAASRPAASLQDDFGAGRAGAFRDQLVSSPHGRRPREYRRCAGADGAPAGFPARPCSRHQQIERAHRAARTDDKPPSAISPPSAANALPRHRLRQHLNQRAIVVDQIGVDHAIAAIRHRVAGLDPERRLSQWQRRIGRRTDEVAGAQRPAVDGGAIAGRIRRQSAASPPQRSPTPAPAASRSARPASVPPAAAPAPRRAEQAKPAGAGSRS